MGTSRQAPGFDTGTERRIDDGRTMARGLGWFSIGLGLAELAFAERICDFLGTSEDRAKLVRLYGLREIATGLGIFSRRTPTEWVWGRVAGDILDIATLSAALGGERKLNVGTAMAAVAGVTVLDVIAGKQLATNRTE